MNAERRFSRLVSSRVEKNLASLILIVVSLSGWELMSRYHFLGLQIWKFFSPPSMIFSEFVNMVISGTLYPHFVASLTRILLGLSLATIFAIPIGIAIGWSATMSRLFGPLVDFLRTIPTIATYPLLLLVVGFGEAPMILVIAIQCFFAICINTIYGARSADKVMVQSIKIMGAGDWQLLRSVIVRVALPYTASGLRIALSLSLVGLITAEMMAANQGLGFLTLYDQRMFNYEGMLAGIFVLSILGASFVYLFSLVEKRLLKWYYATTARGA